jgi:glutamyl-tRNA synthetase
LLDPLANRYFFVEDPVEITVINPPADKEVNVPLHPDFPDRGDRTLKIGKSFFISNEDFQKYNGKIVRLIGLYNVKLGKQTQFLGKQVLPYPKLQWVPMKVLKPDNTLMKGLVERDLTKLKPGERIQLQRICFVYLDVVKNDYIYGYYIHD